MGFLNQVYLTNDLMNWADWLNGICILRVMNIHWSYQNLLFWAGIVWHRFLANQIVRYFKLKKLKNYMRYQVDFFASIEATKNMPFWVMQQNTLSYTVCRNFYFSLFWLVNLNTWGPMLHCICWFSNMSIGIETNHDDT